jgi:hypothetical protein
MVNNQNETLLKLNKYIEELDNIFKILTNHDMIKIRVTLIQFENKKTTIEEYLKRLNNKNVYKEQIKLIVERIKQIELIVEEMVKLYNDVKNKINYKEIINGTEKSIINNVYEYTLFINNNNKITALSSSNIDDKLISFMTDIKDINDIDTSIQGTMSENIKNIFKTLPVVKPLDDSLKKNKKKIIYSDVINKMNKNIKNKLLDNIKNKVLNIIKITNLTSASEKQQEIKYIYEYTLYITNNNEIKSISSSNINDKLIITDIKGIGDVDTSIQGTISDDIKKVYNELSKAKEIKGGSKEKTPKSITKRKNKWINRKSHKYIK